VLTAQSENGEKTVLFQSNPSPGNHP